MDSTLEYVFQQYYAEVLHTLHVCVWGGGRDKEKLLNNNNNNKNEEGPKIIAAEKRFKKMPLTLKTKKPYRKGAGHIKPSSTIHAHILREQSDT